ncbi:MAG TPA: hypothetical protein VFQ61_12200 [Polyangiaceae bacterium]|nr:hypothetical protein [Polyangiaceae bacterium]
MPTFLITRRMSPELAARVLASVRGQRAAPVARRSRPSTMAQLRLAAVLLVAALVTSIVIWRQRSHEHLEAARAELLAAVRRQANSLNPSQKGIAARAELWIARFTGRYEGDWVDPDLQTEEQLTQRLAQPLLYVKGPIDGFRDSPQIAETARNSFKDAFVACLVRPPEARSESALLARVRQVGSRGEQSETLGHVQRLHGALAGLPFLGDAWAKHIQTAPDTLEIDKLRRLFEKAPIESAKKAAQSSILLLALDEPGELTVPAELDGERPHAVRAALIDLDQGRWLLRVRRTVDPRKLSSENRATRASALDACGFALEVRQAVSQVRSASR